MVIDVGVALFLIDNYIIFDLTFNHLFTRIQLSDNNLIYNNL